MRLSPDRSTRSHRHCARVCHHDDAHDPPALVGRVQLSLRRRRRRRSPSASGRRRRRRSRLEGRFITWYAPTVMAHVFSTCVFVC